MEANLFFYEAISTLLKQKGLKCSESIHAEYMIFRYPAFSNDNYLPAKFRICIGPKAITLESDVIRGCHFCQNSTDGLSDEIDSVLSICSLLD